MSSHNRNQPLKSKQGSVFGWYLCGLSYRCAEEAASLLSRKPPFSESQHMNWRIGDWEPGIPFESETSDSGRWGSMAVWGGSGISSILGDNPKARPDAVFIDQNVLIELNGWGEVCLNPEQSYWTAQISYPLGVALLCQNCLLSERIRPAEQVIASANWPSSILCWTGEGCCSEHLVERVEKLKDEAVERCIPQPDSEPSEWPTWVYYGRKELKKFLVRVLPASEVESEIILRYGLERIDLQEFEQTIKGTGYDHTRPISQESEDVKKVKEECFVPKASRSMRMSQAHGLAKVAGMHALKRQLWKEVVCPFRDPRPFVRYGLSIPHGILLFGPPGCGKTYFARQLAEELGCSFIELIPSEVASPYIHGSVPGIREVFEKAQTQAPCVLFIDEFEALVPSRADLGGFQQYKSEEVNEFLAQMNSCAAKNVLVIAASNEPLKIDSAILRTGRLDKHFYVPPPDAKAREEMLALHLSGRPVDPEIDLEEIASDLKGYSASDIRFIVDEAAREAMEHSQTISVQHIESAKRRVPPSVTNKDVQRYLAFRTRGVAS